MTAVPFGVIPSFVLFTPLALLAALLPAIFGHWLETLKRWRALLCVSALGSTLYVVHFALREHYKTHAWVSPAYLWTALTLLSSAGTIWAWCRWRNAAASSPLSDVRPQLKEHAVLALLSLTGVWSMVLCVMIEHPVYHPILTIWVAAWTGSLYQVYLCWQLRAGATATAAPPPELVMLAALVVACVGFGLRAWLPERDVLWTFVGDDRGTIYSSPCLDGDRVYVAAALDQGALPHGELYCLDLATGKKLWKFDDGRNMRPVVSSACLTGGRLYIGEGFFDGTDCKLYCIDAASGQKLWHFQTSGHTAATPCIACGKVFFAAGSDGVYCLDAVTGVKVWQFARRRVHVTPAVEGQRVYAGTFAGENSEVFCLDAASGQPIWRTGVNLSVTGPPTVAGDHLLYGLGNGDYWRSAETPAGCVLCVEARTGHALWRFQANDVVLARPAVDGNTVYFTSRDQHCYALDLLHGKLRWEHAFGSPIVAGAVLQGRRLFVLSTLGRLSCLDADNGNLLGSFDVASHSQTKPRVFGTPTLVNGRICFGAGLADLITGFAPTVYCLRDRW